MTDHLKGKTAGSNLICLHPDTEAFSEYISGLEENERYWTIHKLDMNGNVEDMYWAKAKGPTANVHENSTSDLFQLKKPIGRIYACLSQHVNSLTFEQFNIKYLFHGRALYLVLKQHGGLVRPQRPEAVFLRMISLDPTAWFSQEFFLPYPSLKYSTYPISLKLLCLLQVLPGAIKGNVSFWGGQINNLKTKG